MDDLQGTIAAGLAERYTTLAQKVRAGRAAQR